MKKKEIVVWISLVCTMLLLGVSIFLVLSKKSAKSTETEPISIHYGVEGELVQGLYRPLETWKDSFFYENDQVTLKNLPLNHQLSMVFYHLRDEDLVLDKDEEGFTVKEEVLEKAFQETFQGEIPCPKTAKLDSFFLETPTTVYGDLVEFTYDEAKHQYQGIFQGGAYGTYPLHDSYSKLTQAIEEDGILTIEEKIVFVDIEELLEKNIDFSEDTFTYHVYQDNARTILIDEVSNANEENDYQDMSIDKYLEEALTIHYIFEKDEKGEYHFVKSEIQR